MREADRCNVLVLNKRMNSDDRDAVRDRHFSGTAGAVHYNIGSGHKPVARLMIREPFGSLHRALPEIFDLFRKPDRFQLRAVPEAAVSQLRDRIGNRDGMQLCAFIKSVRINAGDLDPVDLRRDRQVCGKRIVIAGDHAVAELNGVLHAVQNTGLRTRYLYDRLCSQRRRPCSGSCQRQTGRAQKCKCTCRFHHKPSFLSNRMSYIIQSSVRAGSPQFSTPISSSAGSTLPVMTSAVSKTVISISGAV